MKIGEKKGTYLQTLKLNFNDSNRAVVYNFMAEKIFRVGLKFQRRNYSSIKYTGRTFYENTFVHFPLPVNAKIKQQNPHLYEYFGPTYLCFKIYKEVPTKKYSG